MKLATTLMFVAFSKSSTAPSAISLVRSTGPDVRRGTSVTPLRKRTCCLSPRKKYTVPAFRSGAAYDQTVAPPLAIPDLPPNMSSSSSPASQPSRDPGQDRVVLRERRLPIAVRHEERHGRREQDPVHERPLPLASQDTHHPLAMLVERARAPAELLGDPLVEPVVAFDQPLGQVLVALDLLLGQLLYRRGLSGRQRGDRPRVVRGGGRLPFVVDHDGRRADG